VKTVRYTGPAAPPITIADAVSDGQWVTDEAGVAQVPAEVADRLVDQDVWRTGGGKAPTIAEVLAEVDGDPVKAAEALAVEQASDKPRARLVEALTEIVTAPAADEPTAADDPDDGTDTSEED